MKLGFPAVALATLAPLALVACDRPPSADGLQEWKPADHDQELSGGASGENAQQAPPPKLPDGGGGSRTGISAVDIAWSQACATCHGMGGHGDGPSGPTVGAPDLTRVDLQDKYSDDEMAGVITSGKNKMPKFDLSDTVVRGLVAKVRSLRGR